MTTLYVLIMIQIVGIFVSVILSYFAYKAERKRTFISRNHRRKSYMGQAHWPWLIDYFQEYPHSRLKHEFPELHKIALATKRYKEINQLKEKGAISEKKYEKELKKILPLIDIKSDLEFSMFE